MRSIALAVFLATAGSNAQAMESFRVDPWAPVWVLDGLAEPESVALAADGRTLYVSNVGGEGDVKDLQGV